VEKIFQEIKTTVGFARAFYVLIVDADIWLKRNNDLVRLKERIINQFDQHPELKNKVELIFLRNCLEDLICCDLMVIWNTRTPKPIISPPDPMPILHDPEQNHGCPASQLEKFIKQYCGHQESWKKKIYPAVYARSLDISALEAKNRSFSELITFLEKKSRGR